MTRRSPAFLAALVDDLVELDLGPATSAERESTRRWVEERIAGAGAVTRLGLLASAVAVALAVRLTTGSAYHRLPAPRRRAVAERLATTRMPLAAELVKALRSLTVVQLFDQRHPIGR